MSSMRGEAGGLEKHAASKGGCPAQLQLIAALWGTQVQGRLLDPLIFMRRQKSRLPYKALIFKC